VLEVGETLRKAVVREALEETGLAVEPGELLGVFERVLPDDQGRMKYHYVLIDFLCRRVAGELVAGDDAEEVRWFRREELGSLELARETEEVILKGFEKVGPR
jgi:ADP-ribose pyrophosphatase YjhB (NUDIX family)